MVYQEIPGQTLWNLWSCGCRNEFLEKPPWVSPSRLSPQMVWIPKSPLTPDLLSPGTLMRASRLSCLITPFPLPLIRVEL